MFTDSHISKAELGTVSLAYVTANDTGHATY